MSLLRLLCLVASLLVAVSCGRRAACDATSCPTGCCNPGSGRCELGTSADLCGSGGKICATCAGGQCVGGACSRGMGGGAAGGSASDGGCTAPSTSITDAEVVRALISPTTVSPAATPGPSHIVGGSARATGNRVLLFLPGTREVPSEFTFVLREAARLGFLVIALSYPNATSVSELCAMAPAGCHEAVRTELLEGTDTSPLVSVSREDSIEGRLVALLKHLDTLRPEQGWGGFLENGAPRWSAFVVAGHSQGSGFSAFIAQRHQVARVALFAVFDGTLGAGGNIVPAAWISAGPGLTPADRYFGLFHLDDRHDVLGLPIQRGLGMSGAEVSADARGIGACGRRFLTDLPPAVTSGDPTSDAHRSVVVDAATPLDANGTPTLAPVWRFMLGTP